MDRFGLADGCSHVSAGKRDTHCRYMEHMQIQSIYIWICNLSFNNICRNITPRKWNQAEVTPSTETVLEQTDLGREKTRNDPNNHQNKVCQLSGTEQQRSMGNWTGNQGCVYSAIDRPHWCVLLDRQEGKLVERSVINIIIRIKKNIYWRSKQIPTGFSSC